MALLIDPWPPMNSSASISPHNGKPFSSALIVDDHPLFCDALSMTLRAVSDIEEVVTKPCLQDALKYLDGGAVPDLVVLDLNLPDVSGMDGLMRLKRTVVSPVVVVSSMAETQIINAALKAGASGFVPKHSQRDVFRQAIETLRNGGQFVPDGHVMEDPAAQEDHADAVRRLASLTNQQARILQLICEGKLNKQIAYDLSIAETTVKAHVTAIMRKLGVQSRTQAVLIAKDASFQTMLTSGASEH